MNNIVYQKGQILVTPEIFKTARRTYKIAYIERLHLKRPWFIFSIPLSIFSYLLLDTYFAYLYVHEIYICYFVMIVLPLILFNIGTLSVTSKSYTSDNALTGFMPMLRSIRISIEDVLYKSEYKNGGINETNSIDF